MTKCTVRKKKGGLVLSFSPPLIETVVTAVAVIMDLKERVALQMLGPLIHVTRGFSE